MSSTNEHNSLRSRSAHYATAGMLAMLVSACAAPVQQNAPQVNSTADVSSPNVVTTQVTTPGSFRTTGNVQTTELDAIDATISTHQGRVRFENNSVSDQRSQVLLEATARFGSPQCVSAKTGLLNSRKASTLEDCLFDLPEYKLTYAGAPIDSIRYRFLDGRLLQMKLVFDRKMIASSGTDALQSRLSQDLDLPPPSLSPSTNGQSDQSKQSEWVVAQDQIILQQDSSDSAALKISDARLTALVIAMPN